MPTDLKPFDGQLDSPGSELKPFNGALDGEDGSVTRGFKTAMRQIPQTIGGTIGLVGDAVGSEGIRDYGMGVYKKQSDEIQKLSRDSDSFSKVLEGDADPVEFAKYAAGYTGGQALTAFATGGVGGIVGRKVAEKGLERAVAKGATHLASEEAGKQAARRGAVAGAGAAAYGSNLTQEAGGIYPEAVEEAQKDGRLQPDGGLSGADLARVAGSAAAAAGVDTAMEARMLKGVLHGGSEAPTLAGRAVREIPKAMGREALTEGIQTGIERFGAQQSLSDADAIRDYVDSAALGAVGGGLGGAAGSIRQSGAEARAQEAGATPVAEPLQLGHQPDPLVAFPDGTVGRQADVDAYLSRLPEDQRAAERARMMGLAPQDSSPTAETDDGRSAAPEPLPSQAMGIDPAAGPLSTGAAIAVDSGVHGQVLQDAQQQADSAALAEQEEVAAANRAAPPVLDYSDLDDRDRALYDDYFRMLDRETQGHMAAALADDVPDFGSRNVTDEQFLRALGANDQEIADVIQTARGATGPEERAGGATALAADVAQGAQPAAAAAPAQQGRVEPAEAVAPPSSAPAPAPTSLQQGIARARARRTKAPATADIAPKPLDQELAEGVGTYSQKLEASIQDARYKLMQANSVAPALRAVNGYDTDVLSAEVARLESRRAEAKALDDRALRSEVSRGMLKSARQELEASSLTPSERADAVRRASQRGNAADASQEILDAVDAAAAAPKSVREGIAQARTRRAAATSTSSTTPELPRVQVGPDAQSFTNRNAQADRDIADRLNLTAAIEDQFAKGLTVNQATAALGDRLAALGDQGERRSFVSNVRNSLGIPSQMTAEGKNEFAKWQRTRNARGASQVSSEDLGNGWSAFSADSGTRGVPRAEMPQIRAEHRGAMVNFLNARGIAHEQQEVPASDLKPTQVEFSPARVARAKAFEGGDRSILVSSDGHVLDGHHQWMAKLDAGEPVKIIRLDAPIDKLLAEVREFPSAEVGSGVSTPASAPAISDRPQKPRMGESADEVWKAIKDASGGVVSSEAGGRILYPTLRVVGGEDFQMAADGSLRVVVRKTGGVGVRDATNAEVSEFHRELEGDRVQVLLLTPPGYASDYKNQRVLREMHSPSGLSFKPLERRAAPAPAAAALEPAPAPATPKPRRESKAARAAREAEEARAAYFTPGNVVRSYGGFDRVVAYHPPTEPGGRWSVDVIEARKTGPATFEDAPDAQVRRHGTQPTERELRVGPAGRMDVPAGRDDSSMSRGGGDHVAESEEGPYDPNRADSPTQLGDPGQPDGGAEPLAAGSSALASVRRAGDGRVQPRAEIVGLGIAERIERAGSAALVGQEVIGSAHLAELAQVYRDPRYETFRVFFVKGGTIVHATGVSARLPGQSPMIPKGMSDTQYFELFRGDMARTGADGYYVLHNHPSGNPQPSIADLLVTQRLAGEVPGMLAHVVINSNRYAVIKPGEIGGVFNFDAPGAVENRHFGEDQLLKAGKPMAALGTSINSPDALVSIGKSMQKPGWITLVGTGSDQRVRAVAEAPSSILTRNNIYLVATVRRFMRMSGSRSVFAVGSNADINSAPVVNAVSHGVLLDAVPEVGKTLQAGGLGGVPNPLEKTEGRFVAEPPDDAAKFRRDGTESMSPAMAAAMRSLARPSYSPQARAQAVATVRKTVDAIRSAWGNAPDVVVAFDMNDAAVPDAARRADLRQRSGGARGAPEGFYYRGKAYLMASRLATPEDAARVLYHEVLGHHGLRGTFGKQLDGVLNQLATMRRAEVDAKIREYGLRGVNKLDRRAAAEEVLAEMAQNTPELHFVRRAVAAIRTWLRENVPGFRGLRLTDDEIIRNFILPARAFVERSAGATAPSVGFAFSREEGADPDAESRAFLDGEPVAQMTGKEFAPDGVPITEKVTQFYESSGNAQVEVPGIGLVSLDRQAVKSSLFHGIGRDKATAFAAVPDVLKNGKIIHVEAMEGSRDAGMVYHVAAPVRIGDRDMVEVVLVKADSNAKRMYVHEVVLREKLQQPAVKAGADAAEAGVQTRAGAGAVRSVLDRIYSVNPAAEEGRATPSAGEAGGEEPGPMFSRSTVGDYARTAAAEINKTFSAPGGLSWWHKTIGTMYNLAERSSAFKPVFDAAQGFVDDVSHYATDAAELAPKLLPKLETWRDIKKSPISAADNAAVAKPVFEGTLTWARDEQGKPVQVQTLIDAAAGLTADQKGQRLLRNGMIDERMLKAWKGMPLESYEKAVASRYESRMLQPGVVWSDAELRSMFGLTDDQIALYREFRDSTNRSLDTMARADMLRFAGDDAKGLRTMVMDAADAQAAAVLIRDHLAQLASDQPDRSTLLMNTANGIMDRADKVRDLQARGYAPLSRFGRYTVDVVDAKGERQYFGLFETAREANTMAANMRGEFGDAAVSQGTLSEEAFKMFAGVTPETLELFGNALGLDSTGDRAQDQAFQEYLKLTKTNRSAMRRLIHRKGIAGFSEDVGRVLASFIYSNARQTAAGLNMGDLGEAVNAIPKEQGELKDVAVRLAEYVKNPQEEAQAVRGLLFAQYLGGSIASAFVNMTQPAAVTFPWLSQFGGARKAAAALGAAAKNMATKGFQYEPDLAKALKAAEDDGVVSPQEVHQLMAQARGSGSLRSGDGTKLGEARAAGQNALARLSLAWGKVFGAAEQINRRITFIAAYRVARERGDEDPAAFATRAVKETQFVYSKASKMQWGRGAVGGTLMTFKTYSIAYLELLHRMYTQGGPEGKRAALLALGMLMLMGGSGGLPFAEDAEDVADALAQLLGYNISARKARQEVLEAMLPKGIADFLDKGVSGLPGAPLDVSGRLGMGNLIPGTGLLQQKTSHTQDVLEIAGPAGDFASRIFSGALNVAKGNVGAGVLEVAPTAVRNAAKGVDMAATGMYRDTKGYKVLETNHLEAALKAIGFQPQSVAMIQEANSINQRAKGFYNPRAQEIRAEWAAGIFEKDDGKVRAARAAIADWNEKNPDQPMLIRVPDIMRRVREMQKSKDQRIADTAPRAMRAQMRQEAAAARGTQ